MQPRPQSARDLYRSRLRLQAATLLAVRRLWGRMGPDFDAAWAAISPQILLVLSAAQLQAAADAAAYVTLSTLEQGIPQDVAGTLNPRAFVGTASDGRSLATLISEAVITSKVNVGRGLDVESALRSGGSFLDLVTRTQIADAGRGGELVAMTANPAVGGYVRMLNTPSCARCVILAGKRFRWDNDFRRHPRCDCFTIAVNEGTVQTYADTVSPEAYFHSLTPAQQDATFGVAGAQAIRDGASPITVVNAERGTYTPTGRRSPTPGARPTTGQIYTKAGGDRDTAIRLLHEAGYLT